MDDLKRAFEALTGKLIPFNTLFSYADGDQPTVYSTERLREAFRDISAKFTQNWCSVVVHSVLDRLTLKGWDANDKSANDALDAVWNEQRVGLEAYDAHYAALVTGEGYVIAWPGADGQVEVYYNDPRLCVVFYDPERPKVKQFAAKWWTDGARWYMTLYYPDRLEYYATASKNQPSSANAFQPAETPTAPNPYGIVPVFHFRANRRKTAGELNDIITMQDAVNKLLADMMVAAEYGAFPQRYIISNSDTSAIKNAPNEIWDLPASDGQGQPTSAGQFSATDLNNYLNAMDKLANSIAIISRTPKHYFYNATGALSGEALLAMEAPLNKKVQQRQEVFGVTWQELGAFLLKLQGMTVDPSGITPVWKPAETIQPYTEAQTRQLAVSAGIPLVTQLRREGWDTADIDAMKKDEKEQQAKTTAMASALLERARLNSEQDNNPTGQPGGNNRMMENNDNE